MVPQLPGLPSYLGRDCPPSHLPSYPCSQVPEQALMSLPRQHQTSSSTCKVPYSLVRSSLSICRIESDFNGFEVPCVLTPGIHSPSPRSPSYPSPIITGVTLTHSCFIAPLTGRIELTPSRQISDTKRGYSKTRFNTRCYFFKFFSGSLQSFKTRFHPLF